MFDSFLEGLTKWKLTTPEAWFNFIMIGVLGVITICTFVLIIKHNRRPDRRQRCVSKRLRKGKMKNARLFVNPSLQFPSGTFEPDDILVDQRGVVLIKVFPWGLNAYGEPRSETWKIGDSKRNETVPNPLVEMEAQFENFRKLFSGHELYKIPMEMLVIFADNWNNPSFCLGKSVPVMPYDQLKFYLKRRKKQTPRLENVAGVAGAIEGILSPPSGQKEIGAGAEEKA